MHATSGALVGEGAPVLVDLHPSARWWIRRAEQARLSLLVEVKQEEDGLFRLRQDGYALPLLFTLIARKPG